MRTIAWCAVALSLAGCHCGPRCGIREYQTTEPLYNDEQPAIETTPAPTAPLPAQPPKDGPTLTPPPQPAQRERTPYESSLRSHGWFGGRTTSQASRSKSSTTNRSTQTARQSAAPAAKSTVHDESVRQLMADLEKIKREKAALESKLSEDSARQTQQRLELEARLALIQEQMRQQSALQQVAYQQQVSAMSRPLPGYGGPVITSGTPNPPMQMPFSQSGSTCASQYQQQAVPAWNNSVPTWNIPAATPQQKVEQWPYSPQRR